MARRSGAWRGIAAAAGAVLAAGCIGGGSSAESAPTPLAPATEEPTQTPTLTATSSPTATPTPDDPFAVPEEIDLEYLDRVIAALYAIENEGYREMVLAGRVADETSTYLEVTRTPMGAKRQRAADRADGDLISVEGREAAGLVGVPGDTVTQVVELLEVISVPPCFYVEVAEDVSADVLVENPQPIYRYLVLVPKDPGNAAHARNPTPWVIDFMGKNTDDQHERVARDLVGLECSKPLARPVG